jgi:hypothetical protein
MDTHVTAYLPVEEESPAASARVAGKTDAPFLEGGFREGNPEPGVRLPGEAEEPPLGESFGECSGAAAPNVRARLPASAPPWWRRRQSLLLGAAVIALGAAGASAFLVSPYNRVYSVPQMASTVRHWAAEMGIRRTEPVAPAASLAGVPTEPAEPVTREKYQPKRKDEQLQEVLALRGGAPEGSRGDGQSANEPPAESRVSPAPVRDGHPSGREAPPPGYVPSEPGANPASIPTKPVAPPLVAAADAAPPLPAVATPALPAGEPPHDATAAVLAALEPASKPAGSSPPSPAPPAQADAPPPPALPVEPRDPVETAGQLRPAALTPADQVQVLELVTQMAAMVRDLRAQHAQLRADFGKAAADNAARLADFERRLALAEARHALSAAQIAGDPLAPLPTAPAPAPAGEAPAASGSSARPAGSATAVTAPVAVTPVAAALPGSDKGAAKRYRVQAASPGLALLAEIDRGGGDGAQLEVLVGDTIPGYGKITSIGQRGTAWVVTTEHGSIQ